MVQSFESCPIAGLGDHGELLYESFPVGDITKKSDAGSDEFGGKIGHSPWWAENDVVLNGNIHREDWWGNKL